MYLKTNISDIKLRKTQTSKIIQSGGFLGALLSKIAPSGITGSIRNSSSSINIRCRNSKENAWFWKSNTNNFSCRNE